MAEINRDASDGVPCPRCNRIILPREAYLQEDNVTYWWHGECPDCGNVEGVAEVA